ncbi:MAG: YtfJ family protein [Candidatus Marinimicrobia bacterium]|nr:YtfJ family protein [Candidatus Neomarinimicrobiota bacterium]
MNIAAEDSLSEEDISGDKLKTAAVINYKATFLPGFAVSLVLKGKQKDHPNTLYLKDNKHVFVNEWGLTDDTYCTLVFDKEGVLIYRKDGKMSEEEIAEYISVIKANL